MATAQGRPRSAESHQRTEFRSPEAREADQAYIPRRNEETFLKGTVMDAMTRGDAADLFLRFLIKRTRNSVIAGVKDDLTEGPPGRKPSQDAVARHMWFRNLSTQDQSRVSKIIRESVDSAIFGVLVVLDGLSGGNPVEGTTSDFALELQTYADEDTRRENAPEISVRVNPSDTTEALHDLFR